MREIWNTSIPSVLVCFCLSYQALRAHAPYCRLWPYHIFPHYLMNGTIFVKKSHWTQNVSIFSTTFVWNISHSEKDSPRYNHKCTLVLISSALLSLSDINTIWFFRQIFKQSSSIKFHENPCSGSRVKCGLTLTKLILALRNFYAHALEAYKGRGGIAVLILNLRTTLT